MPSVASRATEKVARILRYKKRSSRRQNAMLQAYDSNPLSKRYLRLRKKLGCYPKKSNSTRVEYRNISGRRCGILKGEDTKGLFLFLHGGAYIIGPSSYSWLFLQKLSRSSKMTALLPDYPKAPEWNYHQTLDYIEAFYRQILQENPGREIILGGSSAGGGLALSLFLRMKKHGLTLPTRLILISPWVDLTLQNPLLEAQQDRDISLCKETLSRAAGLYGAGQDLKDPWISPLYGDLTDLPPSLLLTGSEELFLSDCQRLRDKIQEQGSPLIYQEEPGLFHSWPVIPHLPESAEMQQRLCSFLQGKEENDFQGFM